MVEQGEDQLMHFKWQDRTTSTVEDDLIIFPDDVEFKKVSQCTTGRVFILKFKSTSRKLFFWMQEPKDDKDEELCKKATSKLLSRHCKIRRKVLLAMKKRRKMKMMAWL